MSDALTGNRVSGVEGGPNRRLPPPEAAEPLILDLRDAIERQGVTYADVAERAGLETHTVSRIMRGVAIPAPRTLWSIAAALGLEVRALPRRGAS